MWPPGLHKTLMETWIPNASFKFPSDVSITVEDVRAVGVVVVKETVLAASGILSECHGL